LKRLVRFLLFAFLIPVTSLSAYEIEKPTRFRPQPADWSAFDTRECEKHAGQFQFLTCASFFSRDMRDRSAKTPIRPYYKAARKPARQSERISLLLTAARGDGASGKGSCAARMDDCYDGCKREGGAPGLCNKVCTTDRICAGPFSLDYGQFLDFQVEMLAAAPVTSVPAPAASPPPSSSPQSPPLLASSPAVAAAPVLPPQTLPAPNGPILPVAERRSSTVSVGKTSNLVTAFRDCPLCPEMAQLKGGSFMMGSNDDPSEKPVHRVTLKPFALARYPVTVKEWRQCVTAKKCTAEAAGEDDTPVRNLSFEDAEQYVAWLSQTTQQKYRLPAEAEWEYAARAKTATKYWWGNEFVKGMGNCQGCGEPYFENSPTKVGSFAANPLGFYDMAGGVAQWVSDCWHPAYSGAPSDGSSWDAPNCGERILRGGSWLSDASSLRAANRDHYDAAVRYPTHGLRVARSAPDGQQIVSGD